MITRSQKVRDKIWVHWKGRLYGIQSDLKKAQSYARGDEGQELIAPFSCKVLKLHVQAGQAVKKGELVVVVEAMKMEYTLKSQVAGTVAEIKCKVVIR